MCIRDSVWFITSSKRAFMNLAAMAAPTAKEMCIRDRVMPGIRYAVPHPKAENRLHGGVDIWY